MRARNVFVWISYGYLRKVTADGTTGMGCEVLGPEDTIGTGILQYRFCPFISSAQLLFLILIQYLTYAAAIGRFPTKFVFCFYHDLKSVAS